MDHESYQERFRTALTQAVNNVVENKPFYVILKCGTYEASAPLHALPNKGDHFHLAFVEDELKKEFIVKGIHHSFLRFPANNAGQFETTPEILIDLEEVNE